MGVIIIEEWRTADTQTAVRAYLDGPLGARLPTFHPTPGPAVCPICYPLAGQLFERGQGPQPPLHPHCRCSRVPVATYDPATMTTAERIRIGTRLAEADRVARRVVPREVWP